MESLDVRLAGFIKPTKWRLRRSRYKYSGVYAFVLEDKILYVGRSNDMCLRYRHHISNPWYKMLFARTPEPQFLWKRMPNSETYSAEWELIHALNPPLNTTLAPVRQRPKLYKGKRPMKRRFSVSK